MHYLGRLISIAVSYSLFVAITERAFIFLSRLYIARLQRRAKTSSITTPIHDPIEHIVSLDTFDYKETEPIKYRPFETKRHVAMGIKKAVKQDWIRIDQHYLERMKLRKQLVNGHIESCLGASKVANLAIRELYEEIMLDLLPRRFPTMFRIDGDLFFNLITNCRHQISAALSDPHVMLRHLAENIEEDFYFMVPDARHEFILQAFVACFPQGLLPPAKIGLSVSQIHEPVPGYDGRLKKGVNRCFGRMGPGEFVGRLNWALQCNHDQLFLPFDGANTLKSDDSPSKTSQFDPLSSYLRVEHHTLTCLPRTKTVIFTVRTYMTPLTQIKDEGSGPALADACDSMPDKFGIYKNRPTWGPTLSVWLREGGRITGDHHQKPEIPVS